VGTPEFAQSSIKVFIWVLLWIGRELVWWWLIAGFLALAVACVRSQPLTNDILSRVRLTPLPTP
jgi:hypothetical protein